MLVRRDFQYRIQQALRSGGVAVTGSAIAAVQDYIRRTGEGNLRRAVAYIRNRVTDREIPRRFGYKRPTDVSDPPTVTRPPQRSRLNDLPMNRDGGFDAQKAEYYVKKGGKRLNKRQRLLKQLETHVQPIIERFGNNTLLQASDTPVLKLGAAWLNAGPFNTATGDFRWPVYMYDLTGVRNINKFNNNANQFPTVGFRLLSSTAVAGQHNYGYETTVGRDSTDANNTNSWVVQKLPRSTQDLPVAGVSSFIDAFQLKMSVYGARKVASEVYVELWRFTDDKLVPNQHSSVSNLSSGGAPVSEYSTIDQERLDNFWTSMLSKMVGTNNADQIDKDASDGVDIKRLWTFKFGPKDTSMDSVNGSVRNLTLNHQFNRWVKLDWEPTEPTGVNEIGPTNIGNMDFFYPETNANSTTTQPNQTSRVFLVVRGDVAQQHSSNFGVVSTDNRADLFPSFDFTIRRFRTMIHTQDFAPAPVIRNQWTFNAVGVNTYGPLLTYYFWNSAINRYQIKYVGDVLGNYETFTETY